MYIRNPNADERRQMMGRVIGLPRSMRNEIAKKFGGYTSEDFPRLDAILNNKAVIDRNKLRFRPTSEGRQSGAVSTRTAAPSVTVSGICARYNVLFGRSEGMWSLSQPIMLAPGCFDEFLAKKFDPAFRPSHTDPEILGSCKLLNLPDALWFQMTDLTNTPAARNFLADARAGRLPECSTELHVLAEERGNGCRVITRALLSAIVPVGTNKGACPDTYLMVR